MCPPPWLIPPHIARGTTAPSGLCLTSCTPPPLQLSVAFAPTFPPSCYCCAPFRCIFFASLPRLFPFPMCHHGCTGLRGTRIPEALNHAACRGRRDSPFFSCGGVGHVERGRETVFRVVRGGRSGRTVRANHISRRETSGTYEDEDRFRLIGAGFPANTFTTERALYQDFSIIL